jgi:hypothetical protein
MTVKRVISCLVLCMSIHVHAADLIAAPNLTNAENYKDRALASCIATAYKGSAAGEDADTTKSVYLEWTYYDETNANPAVDELVKKYLHRDYSNPLEGYSSAKFSLLKCIDMYHSKELDSQVRKYVPHPDWIGDKPAKIRHK